MREDITETSLPRETRRGSHGWSPTESIGDSGSLRADLVDAALAEPALPSSEELVRKLSEQLELLEVQRQQLSRLLEEAKSC